MANVEPVECISLDQYSLILQNCAVISINRIILHVNTDDSVIKLSDKNDLGTWCNYLASPCRMCLYWILLLDSPGRLSTYIWRKHSCGCWSISREVNVVLQFCHMINLTNKLI